MPSALGVTGGVILVVELIARDETALSAALPSDIVAKVQVPCCVTEAVLSESIARAFRCVAATVPPEPMDYFVYNMLATNRG
jgi:hypothetical protein